GRRAILRDRQDAERRPLRLLEADRPQGRRAPRQEEAKLRGGKRQLRRVAGWTTRYLDSWIHRYVDDLIKLINVMLIRLINVNLITYGAVQAVWAGAGWGVPGGGPGRGAPPRAPPSKGGRSEATSGSGQERARRSCGIDPTEARSTLDDPEAEGLE